MSNPLCSIHFQGEKTTTGSGKDVFVVIFSRGETCLNELVMALIFPATASAAGHRCVCLKSPVQSNLRSGFREHFIPSRVTARKELTLGFNFPLFCPESLLPLMHILHSRQKES